MTACAADSRVQHHVAGGQRHRISIVGLQEHVTGSANWPVDRDCLRSDQQLADISEPSWTRHIEVDRVVTSLPVERKIRIGHERERRNCERIVPITHIDCDRAACSRIGKVGCLERGRAQSGNARALMLKSRYITRRWQIEDDIVWRAAIGDRLQARIGNRRVGAVVENDRAPEILRPAIVVDVVVGVGRERVRHVL